MQDPSSTYIPKHEDAHPNIQILLTYLSQIKNLPNLKTLQMNYEIHKKHFSFNSNM